MGGKYSVVARSIDSLYWQYDWYGDSLVVFIAKAIYALSKYEIVDIRTHGN